MKILSLNEIATIEAAGAPKSPRILTYTFTLRPGMNVQFNLPDDLTTYEVARLIRYLEVLPVPADEPVPPQLTPHIP